MKLSRRQSLHLATTAAALPVRSRIAQAQAYPTRPVRIIVGFAPGGGTDVLARIFGQLLSERLGRPFLIENRTGGLSCSPRSRLGSSGPQSCSIPTWSPHRLICHHLRHCIVNGINRLGRKARFLAAIWQRQARA